MMPTRLSTFLDGLVLLHAGMFLAFWLSNSLFYAETNNFLSNLLGKRLDYIRLLLVISGALLAWSIGRLILLRMGWTHSLTTWTNWSFGVLGVVYILFFYGSFWMLFDKSPIQSTRMVQLFQYFRILIDPIMLLALAVGLGLIQRSTGIERRWSVLAFIPLAALWGIMVLFPPTPLYHQSLPSKPLVIAHRGASFLAPENTLAATELAVSLGAYGLETDVHISLDGVPFLMHDATLDRTTNVRNLFAGRQKERAETFTLAEVRSLNAGEWFVQSDPYRAIALGKVSPSQVESYRSLGVPTLAEELEIVKDSPLAFIFDLTQPPEGHPNHQDYFEQVLAQVHAAGIDSRVWMLAGPDQIATIQAVAPEMKLTAGVDSHAPPDPTSLTAAGYQIVNAEYGLPPRWIAAYQQAGLWVNLWTVDEPWQYSRLWLLGVNSVTTSNAGEMLTLSSPLLSLPYSIYLPLWLTVGIVGGALMAWIIKIYS